jgi:hypothetical protein
MRKEHLTISGLRKIVAIKASMNLGLSDKLKASFTQENITAPLVSRSSVLYYKIKDPN